MVTKFSKFRKKERRLFESTVVGAVFLLITVGIIGLFLFQNVKIASKRTELEHTLQELEAEASQLQQQKEELERNVAATQTEEYQEKVLREQGLYQKPGEEVVTVLPPEELSIEIEEVETKERIWWNPFSW